MNQMQYLIFSPVFLMLLIMSCFFSGCGEFNVMPSTISQMSVSVKSKTGPNNFLNQIIIDDAKVLIREVELENENTGENEDVKADPFIIHLNTDGTLQTLASSTIQNGKFSRIKFEIHKPDENETPPDPEFKEGNSNDLRYSFIIKGRINGNPFIFKSKQSTDVNIDLDNLINLQASGENVTILFNNSLWFISNGDNMDPRDPKNENEINNNLQSSFNKAFEDNDKNGIPDGH